MTPPATNEERKAAKDEVRKWYSSSVDDEWLGCFCEMELAVVIKANRTEARNAVLEARVKEARKLIDALPHAGDLEWQHRRRVFMEATK